MAEFDKKGIQLVAHGEGGSSARLAWWNEGPSTPAPGFSIRRGPLPASPSVCYDRPARSPAFVRRLLGTPGQGNTNAKTQWTAPSVLVTDVTPRRLHFARLRLKGRLESGLCAVWASGVPCRHERTEALSE